MPREAATGHSQPTSRDDKQSPLRLEKCEAKEEMSEEQVTLICRQIARWILEDMRGIEPNKPGKII
jgi:hypothetical protein